MSAQDKHNAKRARLDEATTDDEVVVLDYGAGNVQSICNAIQATGYKVRLVEKPEDITSAKRLLFPGVGAFGSCLEALKQKGFFEPLRNYLKADKPFFGICLGMQTLFEYSEESPGVQGLGVLPGSVKRFSTDPNFPVPHIGWSAVAPMLQDPWPLSEAMPRCYFVHSFRVPMPENGSAPWALACSEYGSPYVCAVRQGNIVATQFHPEKSGQVGLNLLKSWLSGMAPSRDAAIVPRAGLESLKVPPRAKRIIACMDVRSNDQGELIVTKGDQYDVREGGSVRNHGDPVELSARYYQEGADEVAFLNITAFRELVLADQPMLELLRNAAREIFVPLTVGGGIRSYQDGAGNRYDVLDVVDAYFRAGADKVSIGTDAVVAAQSYYTSGRKLSGNSSIERISVKYGRQAVVISFDIKRKYVASPGETKHATVVLGNDSAAAPVGPNGERYAWYCCTIKGGREESELDAVQLAVAVEALGAGEILLNCIDRDGQNKGFELELLQQVKGACSIPVIASSGAGCPDHFASALRSPDVANGKSGGGADAALAAGIFHRREATIEGVKSFLQDEAGISVRIQAAGE